MIGNLTAANERHTAVDTSASIAAGISFSLGLVGCEEVNLSIILKPILFCLLKKASMSMSSKIAGLYAFSPSTVFFYKVRMLVKSVYVDIGGCTYFIVIWVDVRNAFVKEFDEVFRTGLEAVHGLDRKLAGFLDFAADEVDTMARLTKH